MRDVTYYVATSLDGFIAAPDGTWSAFLDEGDHMAVLVDEFADTLPGHVQDALGIQSDATMFDTVIMGWTTYSAALDVGIVSPYPHLRQFVASRHRRSESDDVTVTDDPAATLGRLRKEDGAGIWLAGGGALAGDLVDQIDRLVLKINPVVLGDGVRLFAGARYADRPFTATRVRQFESGVVIAEYRRVSGTRGVTP
ncbi:dihydrofolate reductase family protein [Rhodococcoides corynebacterioides]|uniref:dihydrofolate reductase family protein n=1 Tax=Rhodococcoides corynebacterioides TaxID=53972 RepID=UPI001C9AED7F|nr:dihydrofolate reductase [Rhodococcus corynebacterioides]MBY6349971.1 dihydrofolate reductase family protein [Rhodococcus corynebacterioides]